MRGAAVGRGMYPAVIGIAVGALVVGLLLPFIEGDRPSSAVASGPAFTDTGDSPSLSEDGTPVTSVDGSPVEGGTTPGGAPTGAGSGPSGGPAGSGSAGPGGGDDNAPTGPRTASDQGVTADEIKLGVLLLDLGQTGRIGVATTGVDPDQQKAAFEAYFKEINDRGGVLGRKLVGEYYTFDVTNPDDQLAACNFATEDVKAFTVLAMPGFANAAVLCVTKQHRTPLIITGQGVSRTFYNESEGRLITLQMAGDRQMRNLAALFEDKGLWKDRKIGIISSDEPQWIETVERLLVPTLEEMGHDVVDVARFSTYPRSQGQIAPGVQRMRAAGADTVLHAGSFLNSTQFVQIADQQQWRPRHLVSEFGGMTSDFEAQAMPQSFDGAIAMTSQRFAEWRANIAEDAGDAKCRELYEKATGESVPRSADGSTSNSAYPVILYACGFVRVFEAAAKAAGVNLTRDGFSAALQRLGPTPAAWYLPGGFGPNKTDLADNSRIMQFKFSCRCWHVAGPVGPSRFR